MTDWPPPEPLITPEIFQENQREWLQVARDVLSGKISTEDRFMKKSLLYGLQSPILARIPEVREALEKL